MSWFYVDDGLHGHRKVRNMDRANRLAAIGLWTVSGTYCREQLTGGKLTVAEVESLGGTVELAEVLVTAGMWKRTPTGYRFHEWKVWQETSEEVKNKREQNKKRQQKWRDNRKQNRMSATRNGVTRALSAHGVTGVSLGEGEGEGTYRGEVRDPGGSSDRARAERALRTLQTPLASTGRRP